MLIHYIKGVCVNLERRPKRSTINAITGQPVTPDNPARYQELTTFCVRCRDHTKHTVERDQDEISWFCKICDNLHSTMVRHPKAKAPPRFALRKLTKEQMRAEIEAGMARLAQKT